MSRRENDTPRRTWSFTAAGRTFHVIAYRVSDFPLVVGERRGWAYAITERTAADYLRFSDFGFTTKGQAISAGMAAIRRLTGEAARRVD